jgi:hypothetical protein
MLATGLLLAAGIVAIEATQGPGARQDVRFRLTDSAAARLADATTTLQVN